MTAGPGSYRPAEADGADAAIHDSELAEAHAAARLLERAMPADPMTRSGDFVDRVMAAVAMEPAPRAAGFLGAFTAHPGPATFLASIRSAWRTAADAAGRPFRIRATALAYVLAVLVAAVSLTGVAAIGTAGALGWFQRDGSQEPSGLVTSPEASPSDEIGPSGSPEPSESAEPSESVEPSESSGPGDSLEPGESPRPTSSRAPSASASPGASDDHGESPSPSSSDDSSGSGSPSDSPGPSDTPKPSETPH